MTMAPTARFLPALSRTSTSARPAPVPLPGDHFDPHRIGQDLRNVDGDLGRLAGGPRHLDIRLRPNLFAIELESKVANLSAAVAVWTVVFVPEDDLFNARVSSGRFRLRRC